MFRERSSIKKIFKTIAETYFGPWYTPNPSVLLLKKFECKKLWIKNCWDFLRNSIQSPKLFFTYLRNTLEDTIHGKYVNILIYKIWKFFDLRKYAFFGHFPISSILINAVSPKLQKISDGTDPPPKKKRIKNGHFFLGGGLKVQEFEVCLGPYTKP